MTRRDSQTADLPGMETPRDNKVENAARAYRRAISLRMDTAKDEANKKAKLSELLFKWAEANGIKPTITTSDKGVEMERVVYRRGDLEVDAERPTKWKVKVLLGDELPDEEGDANAEPEDDSEASE